jgi:hypothetical protein
VNVKDVDSTLAGQTIWIRARMQTTRGKGETKEVEVEVCESNLDLTRTWKTLTFKL